jgi:hypothetical protein
MPRAPRDVTLDDLLNILEDDPAVALQGKTRMKRSLRGRVPGKVIDEYFEVSAVRQRLQQPRRRPRKRDRQAAQDDAAKAYKITGPPKSFQVDIADFGTVDRGYRYALVAIDVLSRKLWAFPLKSRSMEESVLPAWKKFLASVKLNKRPKSVSVRLSMVDGDDEFNARAFTSHNDSLQIQTYADFAKFDHVTPDGDRLGIVDRVIGTVKSKLRLYYASNPGTVNRWKDALPVVVKAYNESPHGTLRTVYGDRAETPDDAWELDEDVQLARHDEEREHNAKAHDAAKEWAPGQVVRILEYDGDRLGKAPRTFWSEGTYEVTRQDGYKWRVKPVGEDEELARRFRPEELKAVPRAERRDDAGAADLRESRARAAARRRVVVQERIEPAAPEQVQQPRTTRSMVAKPAREPPPPKPKSGEWVVQVVLKKRKGGREVLVRYLPSWETKASMERYAAEVDEVLESKGSGKKRRYLIKWREAWVAASDIRDLA